MVQRSSLLSTGSWVQQACTVHQTTSPGCLTHHRLLCPSLPIPCEQVNKLDLLCWLSSFLGTLFYSVEIGLAIAIGMAVMLALYNIAFPHTAILGQVPGTSVYRNVKAFPDAKITPGVLVFRVDGPLYYANVTAVQVGCCMMIGNTHG